MVLVLVAFTGCDKKTKFQVDNITVDTLYVKSEEDIKSATVESFDKERYSLDELKTFIESEIQDYNSSKDQSVVEVDELVINDGNAVLVLKYNRLEEFSKFNDIKVELYSAKEILEATFKTPVAYMNVKDGAYVEAPLALEKEEHKVLVLNSGMDVIVDGNVLYYENATIINDNHVQTGSKGYSYIIYKAEK